MGGGNCGCEPACNDGPWGDNGAMMLLIAAIAVVVLYFIIKLAVENALKEVIDKSPLGNLTGNACGGNSLF